MTRSTLAFGVLMLGAGLAAGGAVGTLFHEAPPSGIALAPAPAPAAERGDGGAGAAPAEVRPGRPAPAKIAAADVVALPPGTGDGTIAGSVAGPDGAPLSGVLVRAEIAGCGPEAEEEAPFHPPPGTPPPRRDVAREVRAYALALEREEAGLREAVTDSSGRYALPGLAAKSYTLEAWLVGYRIERAGGDSWEPVAVGGRCDFKAVPIRSVAVSVLLPGGEAPEKAVIAWKPAGGGEGGSDEWKPSEPGITVEPGTYEFTASTASSNDLGGMWVGRRGRLTRAGDDGAVYRSEPRTVTIGTEEGQTLVFRLEGRPGILVKVVYGSPEHPRTARIAALKLAPGAGADPSLLLGEGRVKSEWLDGKTEGALVGLEPGTYLVGVTFRGGQIGPTATVAVGGGLVTQELQVPGAELRDWVKVWVRAPDGTPVPDAEIESGCRGADGNGAGDAGARAGADGSYRVEHYEQGAPGLGSHWSSGGDGQGAGARTYFIQVTSERFGKAEATYDPVKDREVTVQFAAPAILRVTIPGFAASADRDRAILTLESRDEGRGGRGEEEDADIDAAGTAKFPPVKPGRYEVVLRLAPNDGVPGRHMSRWNAAEVARVPLTLGPGETAVAVPLQSLADLTVTFGGDAPGLQRVGADGVPRPTRRGRSAAGEREITFRDLTAGRYRLVSDRGGEMWVDVPAPGPVAFQPSPFNAYFLEVTEKGYLRELGLRTGDLVVAIEGVEFKDRPSMDAALAASRTRETSKFTIQRDGQRFDVTADGKRFEEDDGSFYQPWAR